jgi:hypothetical protein
MDIFDQIAAGVRPAPAPSAHPHQAPAATGEDLRLGYALAKQVPDMARGFSIHTSYGDIAVVPGPLADQIQALVREATERELAACGAQA